MSNTRRAVTRARRAAPAGALLPGRLPLRYVTWRTPPPGQPAPQFTVSRPAPKRRGGRAVAMTATRRDANYQRQTGQRITPAQARRVDAKAGHEIARSLRTAP